MTKPKACYFCVYWSKLGKPALIIMIVRINGIVNFRNSVAAETECLMSYGLHFSVYTVDTDSK